MLEARRMKYVRRERQQKEGQPRGIWSGTAADLRTQTGSTDPFAKSSICLGGQKGKAIYMSSSGCVLLLAKPQHRPRRQISAQGSWGNPGTVRLASLSTLPFKLLIETQFLRLLLNITSRLHRKISSNIH